VTRVVRTTRSLSSRGPLALLCALLLAVGLLAGGCGSGGDDKALKDALAKVDELTARNDAEKAALDAAKKLLVEITSYSWKDGEHDFAWVDKIANAELKDKLAPNVGDLQKAIVEGKVTAKGQVVDAAGRVVDDTQVEVLAFVDQAITDDKNSDVKIEEQRVSMTMKLVKGEWLVDRLDLLSGTNGGEGAQ
jgi:Mce-associated membrane protein